MRRALLLLPISFLFLTVVPADAQRASTAHDSDVISTRAQQATGLYITGPYVQINGAEHLAQVLHRGRMDTAVIDVKDMAGRVNIDSAIPELQGQETGMLGDTRALIARLHQDDIHCVARISAFNDGVLAERYPDRAILDSRPHRHGQIWTSWGTGTAWLNPWDTRNHDMIIALAREAEAAGFDEIQLDYIRFPVDDGTPYAQYPGEQPDVRRRDMLHAFLGRLDDALHIPIGVDVFGIQAYWPGDHSGLGQDLELWSDHVDVYTPMLYLNAMRAWDRGRPNRARRLVQTGIQRLRERLGPRPIIRPFLQAFEQEAEDWGPAFIANQIDGAVRGGADGFLWWHPGSSYAMVQRGMATGLARRLAPIPIPPERARARSSEPLGG